MSRSHQQGRRRVLGFKWIAYHQSHSHEERQTALQIAGLYANVRETQHVGSGEIMVLDFAGKNKLQYFAGRLLVTRLRQFGRRSTKDLGRGSRFALGAVPGKDAVEFSGLGRNLKLNRRQLHLLFFPQSAGQHIELCAQTVIFLCHQQILQPLDLKSLVIGLGVFLREAFGFLRSLLGQFQNSGEDWLGIIFQRVASLGKRAQELELFMGVTR